MLPSTPPTLTAHYGEEATQIADLRMPQGKGPFPVIMVVHGGCWTKGFATKQNTAALASELTKHGYATWNIEYRQVGNAGGGWPGTFLDWANATDYLRTIATTQPIDLKRVYVTGHSAGGHAALWIASRAKLPVDSEVGDFTNPLPIKAAINIDGTGDLAPIGAFTEDYCGKPIITPLMGGTPIEQPVRYKLASPINQLPLHVPQVLIQASFLTPEWAAEYRKRAQAAGDKVEVMPIDSGHFELIAPDTAPGKQVIHTILKTFR